MGAHHGMGSKVPKSEERRASWNGCANEELCERFGSPEPGPERLMRLEVSLSVRGSAVEVQTALGRWSFGCMQGQSVERVTYSRLWGWCDVSALCPRITTQPRRADGRLGQPIAIRAGRARRKHTGLRKAGIPYEERCM